MNNNGVTCCSFVFVFVFSSCSYAMLHPIPITSWLHLSSCRVDNVWCPRLMSLLSKEKHEEQKFKSRRQNKMTRNNHNPKQHTWCISHRFMTQIWGKSFWLIPIPSNNGNCPPSREELTLNSKLCSPSPPPSHSSPPNRCAMFNLMCIPGDDLLWGWQQRVLAICAFTHTPPGHLTAPVFQPTDVAPPFSSRELVPPHNYHQTTVWKASSSVTDHHHSLRPCAICCIMICLGQCVYNVYDRALRVTWLLPCAKTVLFLVWREPTTITRQQMHYSHSFGKLPSVYDLP